MAPESCDLSAASARHLIGAGLLSPVALLESCIARIQAVNPAINAVVTTAYARARAEAHVAEAQVARGEALGPLHGLPVLVKDLNDTEAIRTTYGSPLFAQHVPVADDPVVARLRRQGAIVLGKTNSPEFGTGSNTTNRVFGPTANPFDPTRTAGGSSGGAAAALATGMAPLATGSDSAASIRNPAAFCGLCGIRPTPGLVASDRRKMGLSTNGVEGPLGRSVGDVALLLSAMAGFDSRDLLSWPAGTGAVGGPLRPVDVSGLRIGVSEHLGFAAVEEGVRGLFRERVDVVRARVAKCEDARVDLTGAEEAYWGVRGLHLLATHHDKYRAHGRDLDANLVANLEDALARSTADSAFALAEQTRLHQAFQRVFEHYDVLITPAVNVLPFPHQQNHPTTVRGRPARHYLEWCSILYGISLVGHPAVSIPAGLDEQGTPFGLQIVGARFTDHRLLEIAQALEGLLAGSPTTRRPEPDVAALASGPGLEQRIVRD